jgi:hypothetical protein
LAEAARETVAWEVAAMVSDPVVSMNAPIFVMKRGFVMKRAL